MILQAKEVIKRKFHTENATICFERGFELLPKAEKLKSDTVKRNRNVSGTEKTSRLLSSIEYPSEVSVLQNASRLAHVMEPKVKVTDPTVV